LKKTGYNYTRLKSWAGLLGFFAIVPLAIAGAVLVEGNYPSRARPLLPEALVKIEVGGGHGSGSHLGNGVILTAAHVVTGETTVRVRIASACVPFAPTPATSCSVTVPAEVLWTNSKFDVAMLRVEDVETFKVHRIGIDCSSPKLGEAVIAKGFPLDMGRVETRGYIAGETKALGGLWAEGVIVDIAGGAGMSGGPVVNANTGKVRGIVVGAAGRISPLMVAVPSSTVCALVAAGGAA
jgi:S1-C subfamily serine protease